jgi:hypothetical protein
MLTTEVVVEEEEADAGSVAEAIEVVAIGVERADTVAEYVFSVFSWKLWKKFVSFAF